MFEPGKTSHNLLLSLTDSSNQGEGAMMTFIRVLMIVILLLIRN